jgi:hypothetical protein
VELNKFNNMNNKETVGKYIIIKDINFSDYMKDMLGKIKIFDTFDEACETCGMYEFQDVLVCKIEFNYVEKE